MKKTLSLFLSLAVVLSMLVLPSAHALTDVGAELEQKIGVLQMLGVISGYPDGTFKPGNVLTRAEFCKMAVYLLGKQDEAELEKNFTIFPDVKSSHWACGFINISVKKLKLITGFPDGTFRPDVPITFSQAVTILTKALGYTDADVGLNWPYSYINKAAAIGLTDGVTAASPNAAITRGSGAALFYNMLNTQLKSGGKFVSSIGRIEENAIILDNDAKAADGTSGAVLVEGKASAIKTRSPLPDTYNGLRGTLVYDNADWIKAFIPSASVKKTFILADSTFPKLVSASGEIYTLNAGTPVYLNGVKTTFMNSWYDLAAGTKIDILFTSAGAVDYIIAGNAADISATVILNGTPTQSSLESMLGAKPGAVIYKNGTKSTAGDLVKYDVVIYSESAQLFSVSDFKLSGIYEYAYPNTAAPSKITVLGAEFEVLSSAIPQLAAFKIGDPITLLFTSDLKVAGAVAQTELRVSAAGIYKGAGVELLNGIVLNVAPAEGTSIVAGTLVKVQSALPQFTRFEVIQNQSATVPLDINKGLAGDKEIAGNAVFFEKVGAYGAPVRINRADIVTAAIPANKVYYIDYDSSGRANLIVLDDVTGDLYEYGQLYSGEEKEDTQFGVTITNHVVWVKNSGGESSKYLYDKQIAEKGIWGGVAHDRLNKVSKLIILKQYTGLTRQSFGSGNTMKLGSVYAEISEDVHIYVNATGKYMTASGNTSFEQLISDARAFGTSFEAYIDRDPAEGGKIRVIVVK